MPVWFRAAAQRRRLVDLAPHHVADAQLARDLAEMRDGVTGALGVVDPKPATGTDQLASVADLPAALGIERACDRARPPRVTRNDGEHPQIVGARLVRIADELAAQRGDFGTQLEATALLAARAFALLGHRRVEARTIHFDPALGRHLDGQVDREAERVVQAERIGAADRAAGANQLLEARAARLERARELLLLGLDRVEQHRAAGRAADTPAHDVDHDRSRSPAGTALDPEQPPVAHRAPHDPAQHVAGTLVRWRHALRQQEGHCARVIGDPLVAEHSLSTVSGSWPMNSARRSMIGANRSVR